MLVVAHIFRSSLRVFAFSFFFLFFFFVYWACSFQFVCFGSYVGVFVVMSRCSNHVGGHHYGVNEGLFVYMLNCLYYWEILTRSLLLTPFACWLLLFVEPVRELRREGKRQGYLLIQTLFWDYSMMWMFSWTSWNSRVFLRQGVALLVVWDAACC